LSTTVHGLDSFGASPRGGKVARFAGRGVADTTRMVGASLNAGDGPGGERQAA
jgi:hypothetical protein